MMSPWMLKKYLNQTSLNENEISTQVLVPCFQKISMRSGYNLKNVQFTGGQSEKGVDIQYYEVIGPDKHRLYTGIQVKKQNINQSDATRNLIIQGTLAFGKNITDTSTGHNHRINRWIVATTGDITDPAKEEIRKELSRHGKLISFWDGLTLAELILDNYYDEFIQKLNIDPVIAGSSNILIQWGNPRVPLVISKKLSSNEWTTLELNQTVPVMADAVFITVEVIGEDILPPVVCAVRSTIDEITIESFMSEISPYMLKLKPSDIKAEIRIVGNVKPVRILNRGVRYIR